MRALLMVAVLAGGCASHQYEWGYVGATGPAHWGSTCADGKMQSPTDLSGAVESPLAGVGFAYHASAAHEVNSGHSIQVQPAAGGAVTFGDDTWTLKQFHFHHLAEHTFDGQRSPMELHLVHEGAHGTLVVGVMLVEGSGGAAFAPIFNSPCTEPVTWVVLRTPIIISRGQLDAFATVFPDNSHPLQPRNGRTIKTPTEPAQSYIPRRPRA